MFKGLFMFQVAYAGSYSLSYNLSIPFLSPWAYVTKIVDVCPRRRIAVCATYQEVS